MHASGISTTRLQRITTMLQTYLDAGCPENPKAGPLDEGPEQNE